MNNISSKDYTYSPSFQAYYKSSFSKRLEEAFSTGNITQDLVSVFSDVLTRKMNDKNKIGSGAWGTVYRIDDYYVFKTYQNTVPTVGQTRLNLDTSFDKLKSYCGKVLARIGNIEIIRNAAQNSHKLHPMAKCAEEGTLTYDKSLSEFLTLPQKAFNNIAKDFNALNNIAHESRFYQFDTNNPNNFIKVGKKIKIVDDIVITPCKQANDICSFLHIFVQRGGDIKNKKELFKKCIIACEKYKLPIDNAHKYMCKYMDNLFENAGVNVSYDEYYKVMKNLRENCADDTLRLKRVKEYLTEI